MTRKYYWLKLNKDFFSRLHIKLLRREPGGAELVVIYLKLLLAALSGDGALSYRGCGDLASLAALDIDEDEEKVRALLDFLKAQRLIEVTEGSCLFVEAEEAVGQESGSATRMRRLRVRKAEEKELKGSGPEAGATAAQDAAAAGAACGTVTPCDACGDADSGACVTLSDACSDGAVTLRDACGDAAVTPCDACGDAAVTLRDACSDGAVTLRDACSDAAVTLSDARCDVRDRDRERDRARDRAERAVAPGEAPEASDLFSFYESCLKPLTPHTARRLKELFERLKADGEDAERLIRYGIEEAAANNARTFSYIRACAEAEAKRLKGTGPPKARRNDVRLAARRVEEELKKEGFL